MTKIKPQKETSYADTVRETAETTLTENESWLDWSVLSSALMILLTSLTLCGLITGSSLYYQIYLERWKENQLLELNQVNEEQKQILEAQHITNQSYDVALKKMAEEGFFRQNFKTESDREYEISLLEQFNNFRAYIEDSGKNTMKIPYISLEVASHEGFFEPYTPQLISLSKDIKAYQVRLKLSAGILHEEDLLNLLKKLRRSLYLPGLLELESCSITQLQKPLVQEAPKAFFEATCELLWYTVRILEKPSATGS